MPTSVTLHFSSDTPHLDLSAVAADGDVVWLGSDEGARVERLVRGADGAFGDHQPFPLDALLGLDGDDGEVDVEGLEVSDGWLWVVGSHAAVRPKLEVDDPEDRKAVRRALRRFARVRTEPNRRLLARLPIVAGPNGAAPVLVRAAAGADGAPARHAARLGGRDGTAGHRRDPLSRALARDAHLAPFLDLPSKENGVDIEGLALAGAPGDERLLVGLRGPVLRGWAVVLEVAPRADPDDPSALHLARVGRGGRRVRKHLLDLRGLGVRELQADGDDLLVLAGPTMTLDGRCAVFRWRDALAARDDGHGRDDTVVPRDRLRVALELPYGVGTREDVEHPEGITFARGPDGRRALLVVHDSPDPERRHGRHGLDADLYELEG
jgi:hypothetical protein